MIHSITERLNFESSESKFDESQFQIQDIQGNVLDNNNPLSAYGLGIYNNLYYTD
jgi:hypothetical protein